MKLLSLLFLLASSSVAAQTSPVCEVYPTVASSDAWQATVSHLPLKQQVAAVRQRVSCNPQVRGQKHETGVCFMGVSEAGRRAYEANQEKRRLAEAADPRPHSIVLFCTVDGQYIPADSVAQFERLATQKLVKKTVFYPSTETAIGIYGAQALEGMLVITTINYKPISKK